MILNEKQYRIAAKQRHKMEVTLETDSEDEKTPKWIREAQRNAIKSQIEELETEIKEYELLKEGDIRVTAESSLEQLPLSLIKARIAKGYTQKDLADRLGLSEQQIQRYEASAYKGANISRLAQVANVLGVSVKERWYGEKRAEGSSLFVWDKPDYLEWDKFPLKEMMKRNWIHPEHGQNPVDAVKEFFISNAGEQYASALHRKKYHGQHTPNEYSLLAWQARVIGEAEQQVKEGKVNEFELRDDWISELAGLSVEIDGPLKARKCLEEHGVVLIVEPHLSGTYLDGAAMMLDTDNPVVALTLRYDRIDHFWFVLFHELAHVFFHLQDQLGMDYFDEEEEEGNGNDEFEKEADKYALDRLIPERQWKQCISRFSSNKKAVKADARRIGVHPGIVAGRIRREQNNYTILNDLLGINTVRPLFGLGDEKS